MPNIERASVLLLTYVLIAVAPLAADDLKPRENLTSLIFQAGGEPRAYTRLTADQGATYVFCGQGELRLLSRAVLLFEGDTARYTLDVNIDGARPGHELSAHTEAVADALFDERFRAGELRRASYDLARGCHTVRLELARANVEAVAVRMSWNERAPTLRAWRDVDLTSDQRRAVVQIGDKRSDYYRFEGGVAELEVEGPAWVRLLTRPVGKPAPLTVTVRRKGRSYRAYELIHLPSRRARLVAEPNLRLGRARELFFPVARGRQILRVRVADERLVLFRPQIAERKVSRDSRPPWSVRPRLASIYDDNILRYSDKFIQRFEDGRDPDRFRVSSLDDLIHRADLQASRDFTGLGGREGRFRVDIGHRAYQRNSIKDWTRFALSWRQELRRDRSLEVTANWTPNFYVRHIRDSDLTGRNRTADPFQAFEFERTEGRVRFTHAPGASLNARYHLGLASFRHSEAFREFDSENLFAGIRWDHQLTRQLRLSYAFELTDSSARGWDEAGETRLTSDDTDPSFRQLDLMLAARIRLPSERRQILFLQAEAGRRDYTTDKPATLAPLHNGREDDLLRVYASWQLDLTERYRLTVFGQLRTRSSTAPIELDIGVEKNFDQTELGIRLSTRFGS